MDPEDSKLNKGKRRKRTGGWPRDFADCEAVKKSTSSNRLGTRLRSLRDHRGLTQSQLAERCGFSQAHIANIERGARGGAAIKYSTLAKLAGALGVGVAELMEGLP